MSGHSRLGWHWAGPLGAAAAISLAVAFALLGGGCSDSHPSSVNGVDESSGAAPFSGAFEPGTKTFVLQALEEPIPGQMPVRVELLGSNLQIDAENENISLDVVMYNPGQMTLFPPAVVWLSDFHPEGVAVLNADIQPDPAGGADSTAAPRWGFDYTTLLGSDHLLTPGDTSGAKTWRFHVPGLTAFSFRARAEFGLVPDLPSISGTIFLDRNRNGAFDPDEPPVPDGQVTVRMPNGVSLVTGVHPDGRYAVPVTQPGLYTLLYRLMVRCRCDVIYTTTNPLSVMLPPGPDGRPVSYPHADFGVFVETAPDTIPPVILAPVPLDSLKTDLYGFREAAIEGNTFLVRVGFSGCQPEHPFALYWAPGPEASPMLRSIDLVLTFDDLGELCDAYWQKDLRFSLRPILASGGAMLPITVRFHDPQGVIHTYVWDPIMPQ